MVAPAFRVRLAALVNWPLVNVSVPGTVLAACNVTPPESLIVKLFNPVAGSSLAVVVVAVVPV